MILSQREINIQYLFDCLAYDWYGNGALFASRQEIIKELHLALEEYGKSEIE